MIRLPVLGNPLLSDPPAGIEVHHNCARCPALCCQYVSTEIDAPTTHRDFEMMRWYLMHPGVRVYCEESTGSWFIQFMSRCRFLGDNNLCTIYETRPSVCRELSPERCEFAQGPGDRHLFTSLEEFERWMGERERRKRERAEKRRANGGAVSRRAPNGARRRGESSRRAR